MVVLVPDMVGSVPLRGKLDFDSLSCRACFKCQKNIYNVGGPLESWGVMGRQSLSPETFLAHNFFQKFFRIFLTPDSDSAGANTSENMFFVIVLKNFVHRFFPKGYPC